jgi:hypothetical protein
LPFFGFDATITAWPVIFDAASVVSFDAGLVVSFDAGLVVNFDAALAFSERVCALDIAHLLSWNYLQRFMLVTDGGRALIIINTQQGISPIQLLDDVIGRLRPI